MPADPSEQTLRYGLLAGVFSFLLWGLSPFYWKVVEAVDARVLIAHRVVWSFFFLLLLIRLRGRMGQYLSAFTTARSVLLNLCSGVLIALNWLAYVWAVTNERILETSLGYFLAPLIYVALGWAVLNERPGTVQRAAILLAAAGVALQVIGFGRLPWVALVLALSFGCYGLLRKQSSLGSLTGLGVETTLLAPAAAIFLLLYQPPVQITFATAEPVMRLLIAGSGVVTTIPLLLFAYAARQVRYTTIGILQYISPSCTFLIGLVVYREPMPPGQFLAFCLIWCGLALYTWDSLRQRRGIIQPKPV